jgi:SAM-dependent methyltransferase
LQTARFGAKATGFERSAEVLKTLSIINELENNLISVKKWEDPEPIVDRFDVVLCLNVLHHFHEPEKVLEGLNCAVAIFEVNKEQEPLVNKYFEIKKKIASHREGRVILIAQKIPNLSKLKKLTEHRVFVTGIYGGGKSTYAKAHAKYFNLKYIDFDKYYSYSHSNGNLSGSSEENFFNILSDSYVTDAIPFAMENGSAKGFIQYARENPRENPALIVCCFCPDRKVWAERLKVSKKIDIGIANYANYAQFHYRVLPIYSEFKMEYFDTCANEYVTKEQMYERIKWVKPLLEFI